MQSLHAWNPLVSYKGRECSRAESCPEATLRQLFQALALSSDERLASASFGVLASLLGADDVDEAALGIFHGLPHGTLSQFCPL